MDCLPSRYSFTQDDEKRFKKRLCGFLSHSCWSTSALMEKEKKKIIKRRKGKLSPKINQEEKLWGCTSVIIHFCASSPMCKVFLRLFQSNLIVSSGPSQSPPLFFYFLLCFANRAVRSTCQSQLISLTHASCEETISGCLKDEFYCYHLLNSVESLAQD